MTTPAPDRPPATKARRRALLSGEWKPWGDHPVYAVITLAISVYGLYLARSQLKSNAAPQVIVVGDSAQPRHADCAQAAGRWSWRGEGVGVPTTGVLVLSRRGDAEFTFAGQPAPQGFGKWECREPNQRIRIVWDGINFVDNVSIAEGGSALSGIQSPTGARLIGRRLGQ